MKRNVIKAVLALGLFTSQLQAASSEIDWGLFKVPVDEYSFRCDGPNIPGNHNFEFYLMPDLISENLFRPADTGIKLEHHFAYDFTHPTEDTCKFKNDLLDHAARNGGQLEVRLVTSNAKQIFYNSVSEYGIVSCTGETTEDLEVRLPNGLNVFSEERKIEKVNFVHCL